MLNKKLSHSVHTENVNVTFYEVQIIENKVIFKFNKSSKCKLS